MKADPKPTDSSSNSVFDLLGDKWTLVILRDLLFEGKHTFTEFKASAEKIASNILTSRLKMLDAEGFVIKTASTSNKVKYQYSLTDKAIDLLPVFLALFSWAEKHSEEDAYENAAYQQLKGSDQASIKTFIRKLRKRRDTELGINPSK